jgi:hypothetical protein
VAGPGFPEEHLERVDLICLSPSWRFLSEIEWWL